MLINQADLLSLADRPMTAWLGGLSSLTLIILSEYLIHVADRICKTLRESPMRLIDRWISMGWCVINLGTDQPMVFYEVMRGSSVGLIDRWSLTRVRVLHLGDRSTDGPLWFICGAVRPMVPCGSSVGSFDRWSCFIGKPSQPCSMNRRTVHCRWSDETYSTMIIYLKKLRNRCI